MGEVASMVGIGKGAEELNKATGIKPLDLAMPGNAILDRVAKGTGGGPANTGSLDELRNQAMGMYQEGAGEYADQATNRTDFGNQLAGAALGKRPSIAEAQLKMAQDRNLSQQLAMAKSNRAVNPALASRQAAMTGAQQAQQTAQASGVQKLQEQQAQQQAYQKYLDSLQQTRTGALQAATGAGSAAAQAQAAKSQADNAFLGSIIGTGGSLLALSDETTKKSVAKASDSKDMSPKAFLDALEAYTYKYKNPEQPGAGEGEHLSVMAQDLEKAGPVGKSMVQDTEQGKMVDYGKGFGAILAAQSDLNKRLSEIEKKYGKKA
jgi:hypothetical protein